MLYTKCYFCSSSARIYLNSCFLDSESIMSGTPEGKFSNVLQLYLVSQKKVPTFENS